MQEEARVLDEKMKGVPKYRRIAASLETDIRTGQLLRAHDRATEA